MEFLAEDHTVLPISKFSAYPTPEQPHHQLHPHAYTSDAAFAYKHADETAQALPHLSPSRLSSPIALVHTPVRVRTPVAGAGFYAYDAGVTRGLAAPSLYSSPVSKNGSPSLAGAFALPELVKAEPVSPVPSRGKLAPTLRIVSWTPQAGDEGMMVTILLDPYAIHGAASTSTTAPVFGPGSPPLSPTFRPKAPSTTDQSTITRRFRVVFGAAAAPTKYSRAECDPSSSEDDAMIALTTFAPSRGDMGPLGERVLVAVQIVDEGSRIVEDVIVGEWDAKAIGLATPPRYTKRRSDDVFESTRSSPASRSPLVRTLSSPHVVFANSSRPASPSPHSETPSPGPSSAARHPPSEPAARQPMLVRSSQITGTAASAGRVHKAVLKLNGDLGMMAVGWANEEWTCRRRLVQFWRTQDGNTIDATFRPIAQADFVPNSIVISCIFRDDKNECYVTSVDTIYLLEALVGGRFTVEEKNRIRRNLEGFKPTTVSKSKADSEPFFSTIMGYVAPKPRTIEKDVKVFPWKVLSSALKKIIGKYSAQFSSSASTSPLMPKHLTPSPPTAPRELSDPHQLQHQQRMHLDQYPNTPLPARQHAMIAMAPSQRFNSDGIPVSHTRSASFDFNQLLTSPGFQHEGSSQYADGAGPHGGYQGGQGHLFPSAEDYGVNNRLLPPHMHHARCLSDGPREPFRRSISSGSISYATGSYPSSAGPSYSTYSHGDSYYPPQSQAAPSWGIGYDQAGERRLSASWKEQYGHGSTWGASMGHSRSELYAPASYHASA